MTESPWDALARRYTWFAKKVSPDQLAALSGLYGDDFQRTQLNPLTYHYKD